MKYNIGLYVFLLLGFTSCFDKQLCTKELLINNASQDTLIHAMRFIETSTGKCFLSGDKIYPGQQKKVTFRSAKQCWEQEWARGDSPIIYFVNPLFINDPGVFYDCDSLEIKNQILKISRPSLQEMVDNNFTITYP